MNRLVPLLVLLPFLAGAKPLPVAPARPLPRPEPLAMRPFVLPTATQAKLSNGIPVIIVENHEVPVFSVQVMFRVAGAADPDGKRGLARSTFAMLDEGAGNRDAQAIARDLKRIGASLDSSSGEDTGGVTISGLVQYQPAALDMLADVVLRPTFPDADWDLLRKRWLQDLALSRKDPNQIADRVLAHLLYGDTYSGRLPTEQTYGAITTADQKAFLAQHLVPANAILLVGGDVKPSKILPLLEARFGKWPTTGAAFPRPKPVSALPAEPAVYVVDKPGATQSIVQYIDTIALRRGEPNWLELYLGVEVLGGQFMSRVNLNLREDKAWTYGARCALDSGFGPATFGCNAAVRTDATVGAMREFDKEVRAITADRPITPSDLAYFRGAWLNRFPGRFETSSALLGEQVSIWTYDLPADWLTSRQAKIAAATLESVSAATAAELHAEQGSWLVVGDYAQFSEQLPTLGLPIKKLDVDGNAAQ